MAIRVAVIGGGAAGLCAVRHLASRPSIFSVTAFEQSATIGGTWVYTEQTGTDNYGLPIHSSMYRNLVTNLPKEVMAFPDYPFDESLPSFIKHSDVLAYLQAYASHFNLMQYIKLETQVVKVEPVLNAEPDSEGADCRQNQKWTVTTAPVLDNAQITKEEFDAVIVCNGHYSIPLIPKLPGLESFPGEIMHSHNYRAPEHFKDRTVICLGAGSSGQDIALDLATTAKQVYLCHNKAPLTSPLPSNVQQRAGVSSVNGSTVTLNDHTNITADSFLFCTGYYFTFPFLSPACRLRIHQERITPLYKHLIHTEFPSLSFVGVCKTICPFPQFHVQILLILAVLDGSCKLPSKAEMDADTEADFQQRLSEGMPERYAHTMGGRQWAYNDEVAALAGCTPVPRGVQTLYDAVHSLRRSNLIGYKKFNYKCSDGKFYPEY